MIFDIETVASELAGDFAEVKAPAHYKDPVKINEYITDHVADLIKKAALDPDLGKVRAIGYYTDNFHVLMGDEKQIITKFWDVFADSSYQIGYNILGFDIPFLQRRSMELGIKAPMIRLSKYQIGPIYDLMQILYPSNPKGLKWVAKRYGIKNPLPELTGDRVSEMNDSTLAAYVTNDVRMTKELHEMMDGVYYAINH